MASWHACAFPLSISMSAPTLWPLLPHAQSCDALERVLPWGSALPSSGASFKVAPTAGLEGECHQGLTGSICSILSSLTEDGEGKGGREVVIEGLEEGKERLEDECGQLPPFAIDQTKLVSEFRGREPLTTP